MKFKHMQKKKGITKKIIGVSIAIMLVLALCSCGGTNDSVNGDSALDDDEISTEEVVTDSEYDDTSDENGGKTPVERGYPSNDLQYYIDHPNEPMPEEIVRQLEIPSNADIQRELNKGFDEEYKRQEEWIKEKALEEKWKEENEGDPPTGAKPW